LIHKNLVLSDIKEELSSLSNEVQTLSVEVKAAASSSEAVRDDLGKVFHDIDELRASVQIVDRCLYLIDTFKN